jgi:hypothetical protein
MGTREDRRSDGKDRKEDRAGGDTESPTGGPSQTPDRKPLDRDPTEEGSSGRTPRH